MWKWWAYSRYERHAYRHFTKVCPVSDVDTAWLTSLDSAIDAETVGIPIAEEFLCDAREHYEDVSLPHIVACGFLANDAVAEGMIEFLNFVYPTIRNAIPEGRVSIWGKNPTSRLRRVLSLFPEIHHVDYVEDYRAFLRRVTVYVFPQRSGSGIQTKVQQAMGMGVPVVARTHVLKALGAKDGVHALACDENDSMARAVILLVHNKEMRTRIGKAGSQHIRHAYSIEVVGSKLEKVYLSAIQKHRNTQVR